MWNLPEVLIGGFPNSGASFLCHLVVELGWNPGSSSNLKGADEHNRWGYFEHLPIRNTVWSAAGFDGFQPQFEENLPVEPLNFGGFSGGWQRAKIRWKARLDQVEAYKDNSLPVTYKLFSPRRDSSSSDVVSPTVSSWTKATV